MVILFLDLSLHVVATCGMRSAGGAKFKKTMLNIKLGLDYVTEALKSLSKSQMF